MAARDVLESLQADAAGPEGATVTYDDRVRARLLEDMQRTSASNRALLEETFRKRAAFEAKYGDTVPTRYQSLQDYGRLLQAKQRVDALLTKVGEYAPRDNVVFGSVEARQLNAVGGFLPDSGEYLIVFNRGLLMALLAASNLVIVPLTMTAKTIEDPVDDIDADIVIRLLPRYTHLLAEVSEGRMPSPEITIPVLQFPEKEMRWTYLEDATMQFVFAHEYAHVLRGHLNAEAGGQISEDNGGWGSEYEADSLALDFLVQSWSDTHEGNPLAIAFALQGVCLFFTLLWQIEQYSAEVRGDATSLWTATKTHPPTYLRWLRMLDKIRDRTPPKLLKFMFAQIFTVARALDAYYAGAVAPDRPPTEAGLEWRFQRRAIHAIALHRLVPPHVFIALRSTRAALDAGAAPDEAAIRTIAAAADRELEAAGARPLLDYGPALMTVTRELVELAFANARTLGAAKTRESVDRLAAMFLLDTRTRFPRVAGAG